MYLGNYYFNETLCHFFNTRDSSGALITLGGSPTVAIYSLGGETTPLAEGQTVDVDYDSITGFHRLNLSLTDTTYTAAGDHVVIFDAGTVDGNSIVGEILCRFSLDRNPGPISVEPVTVAGYETGQSPAEQLDVSEILTDLDSIITTLGSGVNAFVTGYDTGQSPSEQVDLSGLSSAIDSVNSNIDDGVNAFVTGYDTGQSPAEQLDVSGIETDLDSIITTLSGDLNAFVTSYDTGQSPGEQVDTAALLADIVNYLRLLVRSDSDVATQLSSQLDELNSDLGGGAGTYNPTTDSLQALEAAIDGIEGGGGGGSSPELLHETTIATLASQTSFTLTDGSADNDAYNGATFIITDQSTATQKAVALCVDYVGSTRTVTLAAQPVTGFTIATGDNVAILAAPPQLPVALPAANGGLVTGDANNRIAGIQGTLTTLDALDTAQDSQHSTTQSTLSTILGDTNELQTDWQNGGRLDLLLDAVKAVTDNLPNSGSLNDLATLVSRITASRAGYLDNLNVGGLVASSAEATSIQNNTRVVRVVPEAIMRPAAGTTTYRIELLLYDAVGNMEAPDSAPTIALVNQAGTDRSSRLDSTTMTLVSTGRYRAIYTSTNTDTVEQLVWTFSVVEGGNTRLYGNHSQVTDVLGVDFTSADRAKLDELHDNRLTSDRAGYLDKLNVSGTIAHSDDAATYQADVSDIEATLGIPTALEGGNNLADNLVDIYNRVGDVANAQQDTDTLIQRRSSIYGAVTDAVVATTTSFSTNLGSILDDVPNGQWRITFLFSSVFGLGVSRLITDFAATNGVVTVSPALPAAPALSDSFVIEPVEAVLTSDYDAAKTAAQPGDEMDLVDAPNTTAVNEIRDAVLAGLDADLTALQEAVDAVQAVTDVLPNDGALTDLGTLATRLSEARAGYLDKLNVSGTLAHSDDAATYRADIGTLATSAEITALASYGDANWSTADLSDVATSAELAALESHGDANWTTANIDTLATQESLNSVATNVSTLLTRIPSALFAGITSLAGWLRLLFRSDAAATTDFAESLTEINASGGSGAGDYANQTGSLEAISEVTQKLDSMLELDEDNHVFTATALANAPSAEVGEEIWNVAWTTAPADGDPESWNLLEALGMLVRREYARNQQDNVVGEVRTYDWDGTTVICRQDATAANGVSTLDQAETPE